VEIDSTPELVSKVYKKLQENIEKYRSVVKRPLTLTEKILSGHLQEISNENIDGGKTYVFLKPDSSITRCNWPNGYASIHASRT